MWPGIIAASATLFAAALGIEYSGLIGIFLLLLLGGIYSLGSVVYKTQERVQKAIILIGIPFIFIITIILAEPSDWQTMLQGLRGAGEGYSFLPAGIPFAIFLGALAYAGAGGNLNLAQSLYIKEKGYGMGKYSGRITNIFKGKKEDVKLEGTTFECNEENLARYNVWWRRINLEHGLVFWATGTFTILLLTVLAYTTVSGQSGIETGINFLLLEASSIASQTFQFVGTLFLVIAGVMLFGTQFSLMGSNARIMSENLVLTNSKRFKISKLPKYFYSFLWLQIVAGIIILSIGFTEPLTLVVVGAVLNAFSMFIYTGMILVLNTTNLEKPLRPSPARYLAVGTAFAFYGIFSLFTIIQYLSN